MEVEAKNSSGNSSMYSDVNLQELNDEEVKVNIGAIVFISILMILGLLGNSSTIFIFLKKYKPSTYRTFILCLAIVDLATCCLSMPFSLIILKFPIMFPYDEMCKGFQFLTFSLCSGSTLILVTIAADRYRKICVPHGAQISMRMARYICILDFFLASVLSWPCIVLFGNKHYETTLHNISGTGCYYSDEFWNTSYPVKYNYFLLSTLLVTFVALLVIYGLIGKQILHINRKRHPNQQMQLSVQKVTRKLYTNKNYCPSESQGNVVSQYEVNEKTEVSVYFTSLFDLTDIKERQSPCEPYKTFIPQKEDDSLTRSTLKRHRSNTTLTV
ncbi:hypothetical protein CHS0354_041385 [Potamilus streckersoni]|uniref:G-protein coupled receptors family 1 profile domain-containing protein n=1 Tax=Potamilus streckersoni TaxID=2493646 RepID=A0AAE0T9W6_9BIVA|nr:hypothetical protein CHS0354_041385 [Potamilus streckersoni]